MARSEKDKKVGLGSQKVLSISRNPFEAQQNRKTKFDVMGRKVRGAQRNVSLARSEAVARRTQMLLPELRKSGKTSQFIDRRFGENNPHLDEETKMLMRFKKERMRQMKVGKRASKFSLEEKGDSDKYQLTHFGKAISDMDTFDKPHGVHDDIENDPLDDTALNFGGGDMPSWRGQRQVPAWQNSSNEADSDRPKTYKEIMEEVIMKSKAAKMDRAREKQEQDDMLARLDNSMTLISSMIQKGSKTDKLKRMIERTEAEAAGEIKQVLLAQRNGIAVDAAKTQDEDSYDSLFLHLANEPRGAAARDRTKTDAELAEEEAERLKELETLRIKRAGGDDDSATAMKLVSAEDLGPESDGLTYKQRRVKGNKVSIWDYSKVKNESDQDDSDEERKSKKGRVVVIESEEENEEDEEEDENEGEEEDEEEDDDEEEEEEDDDEEEEEDEDEEEEDDDESFELPSDLDETDALMPTVSLQESNTTLSKRVVQPIESPFFVEDFFRIPSLPRSEMPFTMALPSSHEDFHVFVNKYCSPRLPEPVRDAFKNESKYKSATSDYEEEQALCARLLGEMLKRMRQANSLQLKPNLKADTVRFYTILLTDLQICATTAALQGKHAPLWRMEPVGQHVSAMSMDPLLASELGSVWQQAVEAVCLRVSRALSNADVLAASVRAAQDSKAASGVPAGIQWPSTAELVLLKLAISVFPTSDHRHAVLAPLMLCLTQLLSHAPIAGPADAAAGLVCASILADMSRKSRKYVPELFSFLSSMFFCLSDESNLPENSLTNKMTPNFLPFFKAIRPAAQSSVDPAFLMSLFSEASGPVSAAVLATRLLPYTLSTREANRMAGAAASNLACALPSAHAQVVGSQCVGSLFALLDECARLLVPDEPMQLATTITETILSPSQAEPDRKEVSARIAAAMDSADYARLQRLLDCAAGPSGNASRSLLPGRPFQIGGAPVPMLCAPETLDPLLASSRALLLRASALSRVKGSQSSSDSLGSISNERRATVQATVRALSGIVTAVQDRRDCIALFRSTVSMRVRTAEAAVPRTFAPLMEDLGDRLRPGDKRRFDPEVMAARERNEVLKLQREVKRQKRNAAREIRLDRQFEVAEADRVRAKREKEREDKYKGLVSDLQNLQASMNQQVRVSAKGLNDEKEKKMKESMHWVKDKVGKTKKDRLMRREVSRQQQ